MITLKQWMETVGYRISEGSNYCWNCYGSDAYMLDSWNGDQDGHSFTIIFDTGSQEVYEVQAHDYRRQRAYRMINADYAKKMKKEARRRAVEKNTAWEGVDYVDLEVEDDWLEKAQAIVQGRDYDTRVSMPVDFTDEELLKYMRAAHDLDITFNQYIEQALRAAIDRHHAEATDCQHP